MFKRFAFYERIPTGWTLVVYHDDLPAKSVNGAQPERHGPYVVPEEYIDVDGTPNMGMIEKAFPNPFPPSKREPKEETVTFDENHMPETWHENEYKKAIEAARSQMPPQWEPPRWDQLTPIQQVGIRAANLEQHKFITELGDQIRDDYANRKTEASA